MIHKIETVLGPIDCSELVVIAPHEHFFIDTTFEAQTPDTEEARQMFSAPMCCTWMYPT